MQVKTSDSEQSFADIDAYLTKEQTKFFHWNIAGDIPDQDHLDNIKNMACNHSATKFLVATKNYTLIYDNVPENLLIVFLVWSGADIPDYLYPRIYIEGRTE